MSKWSKYSTENIQNPSISKWNKYKINNESEEPIGDSWGDFLRKSFIKTVSEAPDIPANLLHLAERGGRKTLGFLREQAGKPNNIDYGAENDFFSPENVDRPSKWIKSGLEKIGIDVTPRPSNSAQRIAGHAIDFAAPGGIFGLPAKGAKAINALKSSGMGALVGGTSGALQEEGVNPLVADLASAIASPYAAAKLSPKNLINGFKNLPETAAKVPLKIFGLSPKGLNVEAAHAARDLGIDLPAAALTDSKLTALADQFVGKTPYFGNKLQKKYLNTEAQTKDSLNKIYDEIGPVKTPEIESEIANLYNQVSSNLPQEAKVKPIHLKKAIDDIKIDTAVLSPGEKDLLNTIETLRSEIEPTSKLVSQYGPLKVPLQEFDVNKLIGTKKSLNSIIKWDMDQGVKNQLRNIQKAVTKDIAEYGKENPEWYRSFKEADSLFGKVAKREKIERLLTNKSTNAATDNISYNALSKAINSPEKQALLKKQLAPETFAKIEKLGNVAKALAIKNRNIPNPSGTSVTNTISLYLGAFYTPQALAGAIGTAGLTKILTDKKLLDLALKYAEKPNVANSMSFNKYLKDTTGYSALALSKELNRSQKEEERK